MRLHSLLLLCLIFSLVPLFFLLAAHTVIFCEAAYAYEFTALGVYASVPHASALTIHLLGYYRGTSQLPDAFTPLEQSHLADVKGLFMKGTALLHALILCSVALLCFLLHLSGNPRLILTQILLFTGSVLSLLPLLFLFANFSGLFIRFHSFFFPQGNWQFSQDSLLIQLYPQQFFQDFAFFIVLQVFCIGILLLVFYAFLSRKR